MANEANDEFLRHNKMIAESVQAGIKRESIPELQTVTLTVPYCQICRTTIERAQAGVVVFGSVMAVDTTCSPDPVDVTRRLGNRDTYLAYHWNCFTSKMSELITASLHAAQNNLVSLFKPGTDQ